MSEDKVCVLYWIDGGWCFENDFNNMYLINHYGRDEAFETMVELFATDHDIADIVDSKLEMKNMDKDAENVNKVIRKVISITVIIGIMSLAFVVLM